MTSKTLTRTPNALTVTLAADCSQAAWEAAVDWINARVSPSVQPVCVDHGETITWLFPAAA
jgi:hypothetical protein